MRIFTSYREVAVFIEHTSVPRLRELLACLDLLGNGGSVGSLSLDDRELIVAVRDRENFFRQVAGMKLDRALIVCGRGDDYCG